MDKKLIITISRTFGSGGHEIGKKLAEQLQLPFYDKNLLEMMSDKTGISVEGLANTDEKLLNRLVDPYSAALGQQYATNLYIFKIQKKLIQDLADKESCIIVGRLADWILEDRTDVLRIFIIAPKEDRIRRIMSNENLSEHDAEKMIHQVDKLRKGYYSFFTDKSWDSPDTKDIIINSSLKGIDGTVDILKSIIEQI